MRATCIKVLLISILVLGLTATANAVTIDPSNSNVQYSGRWNTDNASQPWACWKGCSFKVKFNGTAITANLDAGTVNEQVRVIIDGVPNAATTTVSKNRGDVTLASGLASGEHTVEVMKETFGGTSVTYMTLYSIDITGTIMTPPAKPSMRIEYFGDSNMDGSSLYSEQNQGNHGSYYAYPATVARMLNAEFNDESVGGATIDNGGDNDVRSFIFSEEYYTQNTSYRSGFDPDVIVINAGANDVGAGKVTIKTRYKNAISDLRTVYGNTPHIVLFNAYGWDPDEPAEYTQEVVDEVGGNLSACVFPWMWEQWHGSMIEHAGEAKILANHILSLGLGFTQVQDTEVFSGFGENFDVANGSFEYAGIGDFAAYGWRYYEDDNIERVYDPSGAYDGDYYLELIAGGSGNAGSVRQGTDATGDFEMGATTSTQDYYITLMMKGTSGAQAQISAYYQDQQVYDFDGSTSQTVNVTTSWQEYTVHLTAPAGTWKTFIFLKATSGTVDFDAIVMSDSETASYCGDGTCDPDEDICNCASDCGTPPSTESNCTDGDDNDCDGDTDCDDTDCDSDPACYVAYCGSGVCDDGEDSCNCEADCGAPPAENCTNGDDDDCDGDADCADSDCDTDPACLPDTDAPTPDPMTFASAPAATSSSSIAMQASTATDDSGVEYYFDCTAGGGTDSGWQDSTFYEDTALAAETQYTYTVVARDKSSNQNATAISVAASATTDAAPVSGLKMDTGMVSGVSDSTWTVVNLSQTYNSMVVVATANYDNTSDSMAVRIQNASGSSFDVSVDAPGGSATSADVYYMVVEEGVYTTAADGVKMEAVKYTSTSTSAKNAWATESASYANSYTSPVVLGQVMSYNDANFSAFWSNNGTTQGTPPSATTIGVGKHVGEDTTTARSNETVGYIVLESGSGTIDGTDYIAAVGADTVSGVGTAPPYTYAISGLTNASVAVVSQVAMDGGDGSWAILYGANPVSASAINIAADEDIIGDTERAHTTEQFAYVVFEEDVTPSYCGDTTCDADEDQCNCASDCGTPPSTESSCTDSDDNDCDGDTDCDDADCVDDPACYVAYCGSGICDDGEDQCNCATDCGTPPSAETSCTDGISNDCDADVDCDDADCDADPACAAGGTIDFTATEDTYVKQRKTSDNYGTSADLRVRASSVSQIDSYVKFNVSGVGSVTSAILKVYSDNVNMTVNVYSSANTTWSESSMTWSNAPGTTGSSIDSTAVTTGWAEFDVTSAVSGNGTYGFVLQGATDATGRDFQSSEGSNPPVLTVTY